MPRQQGQVSLETCAHPMWRSGAAKILGNERVSLSWLQGSWKIHSAASEPSEQHTLPLLPSPCALQMPGKSCSWEDTAVTMPNTQDKRPFSWTLKPWDPVLSNWSGGAPGTASIIFLSNHVSKGSRCSEPGVIRFRKIKKCDGSYTWMWRSNS